MDGSAINPNEINRYEVTEVYAHPDAQADIVLVHGLNGHPQSTWTAKNGLFWPTELLPITFNSKDPSKLAKVRILVYGYNADVVAFGEKSSSHDRIHEHAQSLVTSLALERKSEEADENPIIWVAHSLGGILVKRALEISHDYQGKSNDEIRSIAVSTFGIIFLGTPHTGADPARWGVILQGMVSALMPKKALDTESILIKTLVTNNETLANINLHFLDIYQRYKICMVHESLKSDFKGTKAFVVDQISAGPLLPDVSYFGIEATHSGICKYESKRAPGYVNVSTKLKTWALECPPVIRGRWSQERKKQIEEREAQIRELRGDFEDPAKAPPMTHDLSNVSNSAVISTSMIQSVASIEPDDLDNNTEYFIKPPGFRPNSLFIGRQEELNEMHKMLFDERRRAQGSCAVLIQCMAGGGKSHLARQYAYEHKTEYPGGIFWLRAKSAEEITAGFWQIARKAALRSSTMASEDPKALDNPDQFVKLVKKWLNHRHGWLLVFDGIHFDDSLRRFIPDSTDTSIIFTSTEKSVSGDHHFMNPQILKLPLLSAREAQRLLLFELDKREPFLQDDLKHSMELVQAMQFLPVVIHVVAQRLKATDEPLSRFARSYASGLKGLRELQAFSSIVEQLEKLAAYETLNLIRILCFFSQHVPVEMISLGLDALDVPVKATERITGKSLNNTFKVLNKFALIDRNEHEGSLDSSQTSRGSRDLLADNIDVIKLHSVVQGFFVDTLHGKGELPMWLDRAINVFCHSFHEANERIARKTSTGLVEDYRLYEIHGMKLHQHLERNKKEYIRRHKKEHLDPDVTCNMLEDVLSEIHREIARRTPESSYMITGGRPDAFQTSIFDRASSSSDTGLDPETPADKFADSASFFLEDKEQIESPSSLIHDPHFLQEIASMRQIRFKPPFQKEDTGYDSDREGSTIKVQKPLQSKSRPDSPETPGGAWKTVKRRAKMKSPKFDTRTIRKVETRQSRDKAGAIRPPNVIIPRLTRETVQGVIQKLDNQTQSRGRLSGQSGAEVALAHINKTSPPPARGGGMIMDRRISGQKQSSKQDSITSAITRTPTYAAAVAGQTRDTASRYGTESVTSDTTSNLDYPTPTSAIASLQQFHQDRQRSNPPRPQTPYTPMPPYPQSPGLYYQQPYPSSDTALYALQDRYSSQENLKPVSDPFNNIYPLLTGPIPTERSPVPYTSIAPPRKRHLPHDYYGWDSQSYPNSMENSLHQDEPNTQSLNALPTHFQSFSSPNLHFQQPPHQPQPQRPPQSRPQDQYTYRPSSTYIPGHPEFSFPFPTATPSSFHINPNVNSTPTSHSQPMSRDPSGQSRSSHLSHSSNLSRSSPLSPNRPRSTSTSASTSTKRQRGSMAESEPLPQRPTFSPRVTHGYSYPARREVERERGMARKSPRLGNARMMGVDEEREAGYSYGQAQGQGQPQLQEQGVWNPAAKIFSPRRVPKGEISFVYPGSPSVGSAGEERLEAPEMKRGGSEGSGSGGLVVGDRVVEFGERGLGLGAGMGSASGFGLRREGSLRIEFGETGLGIETGVGSSREPVLGVGRGLGLRKRGGDVRGWYGGDEDRRRSR